MLTYEIKNNFVIKILNVKYEGKVIFLPHIAKLVPVQFFLAYIILAHTFLSSCDTCTLISYAVSRNKF